MAKAFEYEYLEPYQGNFQIAYLVDYIANLIKTQDETWLNSPSNFSALKNVYSDNAVKAWIVDRFNAGKIRSEAPFGLRLSTDQLDDLNAGETVIINLLELGIVPEFWAKQNV